MDLLNGKIKAIYFQYLAAAFGSAMITSVYSIVDMAMVGQYQGPDGTAALAVVAPVWNIIYSLGLLVGIGGSVIFSMKRGDSVRRGHFVRSGMGRRDPLRVPDPDLLRRGRSPAGSCAEVYAANQICVPTVFVQSDAGGVSA